MTNLKRKWTVYVIHHTHTDVGYTEHQHRVARYHAQFQRSALQIVDEISSGRRPEWRDFRWTVETFWSAEQFLSAASAKEREAFAKAVREGFLGLSATYLHNNELLDSELLGKFVQRSVDYGRSIDVKVDTAFSADVNGFGWGHAEALAKNGIENLFTSIHTHHGLAPTGRRQNAFWWEAPCGKKVLVWNGEHYNLGNQLGLAPAAGSNYFFEDELRPNNAQEDMLPVAEKRLIRYLQQLEKDDYPYDFVPLTVSGLITDNSPPSIRILEFAQLWNALHGASVHLELVNVDAFFRVISPRLGEVPTHSGDWPDWWSDGVASFPASTRIFRHAQRQWKLVREAQRTRGLSVDEERMAAAEQHLTMYGEHTFHHSDSLTEPFDLAVIAQAGHKKLQAQAAYDAMVDVTDGIQYALGEAPYLDSRALRYKVVNLSSDQVQGSAEMFLEHTDFELVEKIARVIDASTGEEVPHQKVNALRGLSLHVDVELEAGGERVFEVQPVPLTLSTIGSDFADHIHGDVAWQAPAVEKVVRTPQSIETQWLRLAWEPVVGITEWTDKTTGRSLLLADRQHAPFTPVYERTPAGAPHEAAPKRSARIVMGRNRKGTDVLRSAAVMTDAKVLAVGDLYVTLQFLYEGPGTVFYRSLVKVWVEHPRVDVRVQMNKESVWDPESLYISLPFTSGPESELWLDKAGGPIRPWKDQIPGTLTDFYCIQNGFLSIGSDMGLVVSTPDAPLLQLGSLEHEVRLLQGHPQLLERQPLPYSWALTNYWETNFEASLGGFHEFAYSVQWGPELTERTEAERVCRGLVNRLRTFRAS